MVNRGLNRRKLLDRWFASIDVRGRVTGGEHAIQKGSEKRHIAHDRAPQKSNNFDETATNDSSQLGMRCGRSVFFLVASLAIMVSR
jgi:hypothetical protein